MSPRRSSRCASRLLLALALSGVGACGRPEERGYWAGTARKFAVSPSGNVVGVSCHNCYRTDLATSPENLDATLTKLHDAQRAGADLLELDVRDEADTWYVAHDDDGATNRASLDDVLADEAVLAGDQLLYVEIKEDQAADRNRLLTLLMSFAAMGYAHPGRDVVIRAFNSRVEQLHGVRDLLNAGALGDESAHFRTQVLYTMAEAADRAAIERAMDTAVNDGMDGVEFNYTSDHVLELLASARQRKLGTNVWTFGASNGTAKCREFRDATDAVTTDSALDSCRAAIEAP
jgi:glycerophosphoryl diester phosphodiesterase